MKKPILSYLFNILVFCVIQTFLCDVKANNGLKPNIILIVADDLGWNDVGFHGSSQIPTPNIDTLAYSGIILNNYYVNPICTPSRSALLTGKYPIHNGMQHGVITGTEPRGLPLSEKLLPEYLRELGYRNHIVGKWHLGSYKKVYTPTFRGFDSHLGFWIGHQDYFDHTIEGWRRQTWGLDMRRNMEVAKDLHGKYSTDIFTNEAVKIIDNHDVTTPLFLYLAHAAVHSGNSYNPLPAPDEYVSKFSYIKDYPRQRFAGMMSKLDESVGDVISALQEKKILNNSIIIFTTDNGGAAAGFNENAASNFPLRGVKSTLWEGGIRGSALVWSPLLRANVSHRVSQDLMHITDWLPTILDAVSGGSREKSKTTTLDGTSMWKTFSEGFPSPREEILHNIDDISGLYSLMKDSWKYLKGDSYGGEWNDWYGPSGRDYKYNFTALEQSKTYKILKSINSIPDKVKIKEIRKNATISCSPNSTPHTECKPAEKACLFNINLDPCEKYNVADRFPDVVKKLEEILQRYNATAVPPGNLPFDQRGDPKYWDYIWTNFGDYL
ncbi:arylsulfatase B [Coccinella septempunctata]|uniref:arylsulfatase B n=1 Tax=Coccinella septempunctata TaxID=41139 RepID=UPI001D081D51|nr:arylsulfatase B [Coccinella septempunctata]